MRLVNFVLAFLMLAPLGLAQTSREKPVQTICRTSNPPTEAEQWFCRVFDDTVSDWFQTAGGSKFQRREEILLLALTTEPWRNDGKLLESVTINGRWMDKGVWTKTTSISVMGPELAKEPWFWIGTVSLKKGDRPNTTWEQANEDMLRMAAAYLQRYLRRHPSPSQYAFAR